MKCHRKSCLFNSIENRGLNRSVVPAEGGELAEELLEAEVLQAAGQMVAPPATTQLAYLQSC